MADPISKFTGSERAAILLMALGEQDAAEILKLMDPKEVHQLGAAMSDIKNVSKSEIMSVLNIFNTQTGAQSALGMGSDDYIRKTLTMALGDEKASGVIDKILMGSRSKGLDTMKWMDSHSIAEIINQEHPQIIAIILSRLESEQAAEVLERLNKEKQPQVLMAIATMEGIPPAALHELDTIMEGQFSTQTNIKKSAVGGVKTAADILNFAGTSLETELLENISEIDESLSTEIEENMFVFENLKDLDDRSMQSLVQNIDSAVLIIALKGASDNMKEKIFANMSKRAAETMREDLEIQGPVKLSEVESKQKEILSIARDLADEGTIALGSSGGEEYV